MSNQNDAMKKSVSNYNLIADSFKLVEDDQSDNSGFCVIINRLWNQLLNDISDDNTKMSSEEAREKKRVIESLLNKFTSDIDVYNKNLDLLNNEIIEISKSGADAIPEELNSKISALSLTKSQKERDVKLLSVLKLAAIENNVRFNQTCRVAKIFKTLLRMCITDEELAMYSTKYISEITNKYMNVFNLNSDTITEELAPTKFEHFLISEMNRYKMNGKIRTELSGLVMLISHIFEEYNSFATVYNEKIRGSQEEVLELIDLESFKDFAYDFDSELSLVGGPNEFLRSKLEYVREKINYVLIEKAMAISVEYPDKNIIKDLMTISATIKNNILDVDPFHSYKVVLDTSVETSGSPSIVVAALYERSLKNMATSYYNAVKGLTEDGKELPLDLNTFRFIHLSLSILLSNPDQMLVMMVL